MPTPDLPDLIDRLGTASLQARELLAEIRTATKSLRQAERDAAAQLELLRVEMGVIATKAASEAVTSALGREITELSTTIKQRSNEVFEHFKFYVEQAALADQDPVRASQYAAFLRGERGPYVTPGRGTSQGSGKRVGRPTGQNRNGARHG